MNVRALMIVGPTAVGKTGLAVAIAERAGAEILSCDSRQIYRGLSLGTAKPTAGERERAPHHLVDLVEPGEGFSAGAWARAARRILHELGGRDTPALVVGGSGLYLRALRSGLPELPGDPALRTRLHAEARSAGTAALHERLRALDPVAAARMHPKNRERIVRALEVCLASGRPMSDLWRERERARSAFDAPLVVLTRPRDVLHARIDARARRMFDEGLLDEVAALLDRGFGPDWPSYRTLGYPEAALCLGEALSREEALQRVREKTRQFAKRQLTWFRREPGAEWIDLETAAEEELVRALAERLQSGPGTPLSAAPAGDAPTLHP